MSGAKRASDIIELHHVLTAKIEDTGAVTLGLGDVDAQVALDERVVLMQTPGVISIPPIGAETVSLNTSNGYITIAARHVPTGSIAGNVKMGETVVYAPGSQASTIYKNDGSVATFTTHDNTGNGRSVYAMVAPTGFTWFMPWGKATFDEKGFHVQHASGARIDLGAISGLPGPLSSMGAYVSISGPIVRIEGSTISLGTTAGVPEPVAKSSTLLAVLDSLSTVLDALAAPSAYVAPPSGGPCLAGPELETAIAAAVGAIAAAAATLPSASTSVT